MTIERTGRVAAPAALALFAFVGAVMSDGPILVGTGIAGVVSAVAAVLAWERITGWPLAATLAPLVGGVVVLGHGQSANLVWMCLCIIAAWLALTSAPPVVLTAGVVLGATVVWEWIQETEEPGWAAWFVGTAFTLVACSFARRLRMTVEQLREAQDQLAERSRAEERNRIAGDVHDVLGHVLTVSLLHIGSARLAVDEEPDDARRALAEAERLTRESLDEVRASVGLMRADGRGETAPLPDATAIPELAESFRRAGTRVEVTVEGDLAALGSTRGLVAYRIVQEALTNAVKHAPGEPVNVRAMVTVDDATMTITNHCIVDGPVVDGTGVRGMRDRAEGAGGRLTAGPSNTGWSVEAVLPA